MDNNSSSWQSIGIGFIFIGLIGWFSIALFEQIIHAPWQFLSIFVALLGTLINADVFAAYKANLGFVWA